MKYILSKNIKLRTGISASHSLSAEGHKLNYQKKHLKQKEFINCKQQLAVYDSRDGFTLLELTISIAIIGIIVLIIAGAMRLGSRSVASGEERIESLERIRTSLNIIDSQIQSEIPLTYNDEDGNKKYYFKGEKEFMQFTTNYSIWGGEKGYVTATYKVEAGENGKQILYATEKIIGLEGERSTKLFDTFENIYFEYFYKDPAEEEGEWVNEWTDDVNIPEKIKLHLVKETRDLFLVIPLRTTGVMTQTSLRKSKLKAPDEEE